MLNKYTSKPKKETPLILKTTASILILSTLNNCQTMGRKQIGRVTRVILEQETLINAIETERQQLEVTTAVRRNETLLKAEAHLLAALNGIKKSNKVIREVLGNE